MIRVGLIDSGIDPGLQRHVAAMAAFTGAPLSADELGHGTTVARLVLSHAPDARLLVAQAFGPRARATPESVAGALDWLRRERADLVNLSLGMARDRPVLQAAVEAALRAGIVLIASTPARGAPVFPAACPGVIRATGDARCAPSEVSRLGGAPADYGACPNDSEGRPGGASLASAHLTGHLAHAMARDPAANPRELLDRIATYGGRERRTG